MNWINNAAGMSETLAEVPDMAKAYRKLDESLWGAGHIPQELLELCRLRLADLHRSARDRQARLELSQGKLEARSRWDSDPVFTPDERVCLAFTEVYAMDVQAITDEQAQAVKTHFGDAGLIHLIEALGVFDGAIRLGLLWQLPSSDAAAVGV